MDKFKVRLKQREALENAFDCWVDPYLSEAIEVKSELMTSEVVVPTAVYPLLGWLLLVMLSCVWMSRQGDG
jgi:hypothetical protein